MGLPVGASTVLVTGASSGIGAALAVALSRRGATVGMVGRRPDKLDAVLAACDNPGRHRAWTQDLGDLDAAEALVHEAWAHFGRIDVLVNNAAIPMVRPAARLTDGDVELAMRVNFLSPVRMTLALMRRMDRGMIVNVASLGGRVGIAHEAAYCASKFALTGWSEALAMDLDGGPIEIRLIQPGPIDTDIRDRPGTEPPVFTPPDLVAPGVVADGIIAAIEGDTFEHYLPDLASVVSLKDSDIDAYIKMNADLRRSQTMGAER